MDGMAPAWLQGKPATPAPRKLPMAAPPAQLVMTRMMCGRVIDSLKEGWNPGPRAVRIVGLIGDLMG